MPQLALWEAPAEASAEPVPPPTVPALPPLPPVRAVDRHPVSVYLAARRGHSRRAMRQALQTAARLLTGGRIAYDQVPWEELDYQHLAALRAALVEPRAEGHAPYSPATANLVLTAVRGVMREASRLGLMSRERYLQAADVPPIPNRRLPKGRMLSPQELGRLFTTCARDPSPRGRRDAAILAVMTVCGPRRAELADLDIEDLDAAELTLRVRHGKGGRERLLYATPQTWEALGDWLAVRGQDAGALFYPITQRGKLTPGRLYDKSIAWILSRRARQAGCRPFTPHDLRRTCISTLLESGADLVTVSQLAGHASVTTTARYDRRGEAAKRAAAARLTIPFAPWRP